MNEKEEYLQEGRTVGQLFDGRYHLLEILGTGGFATVFKAKQIDLRRQVAVKIYHPQVAQDEQFMQRFTREAQALNKLSHENIVAIYHIGLSSTEVPYMVMELLGSNNLRRLLNREELLEPALALRIIRDAAQALAFVHQNGIVHRDIKPENIVLADKPEPLTVKLIDFGLARDSHSENQKLTQTGELIGSASYMSPEQCAGQKVDARSDIYSLGVCLYEVLTGNKPFTADTPVGIMYKHLNEAIPRIEVQQNSRAEKLNIILACSMCKNANGRYQSMSEFAEAIQTLLDTGEQGSLPGNALVNKGAIGKILAAMLTLAIASGLVWSLTRQRENKSDEFGINRADAKSKLTSLHRTVNQLSLDSHDSVSNNQSTLLSQSKSIAVQARSLLPKLKQIKNESMLLQYYLDMSNFGHIQHDFNFSIAASLKAAKYSSSGSKNSSVEAAYCFYQAAMSYWNLDEISQTRRNALKALDYLKHVDLQDTAGRPSIEGGYNVVSLKTYLIDVLARSYLIEDDIDNFEKYAALIALPELSFRTTTPVKILLARIYFQKGESHKAIKILTAATKSITDLTGQAEPGTIDYFEKLQLQNIADCYLIYGCKSNANELYRELSRMQEDDLSTNYLDALLREGAYSLEMGYCQQSAHDFEKILDSNHSRWNDSISTEALLACLCAYTKGHYDDKRKQLLQRAKKHLQQKTKDWPLPIVSYLLSEIGGPELYQQSKENPDHLTDANWFLAQECLRAKQRDAATKFFNRILSLERESNNRYILTKQFLKLERDQNFRIDSKGLL